MTVETIVDWSSVGSIKLLIYFSKPAVVETRDDWSEADEIYPSDPKPKAIAIRFAPEMKPAVLNSLLIPPVVDRMSNCNSVVVEMRVGVDKKSDVRYPLVIPPVVDNKLSCNPVVVEMSVGVERKSDVKYPLVIPATVDTTVEMNVD